MSADRETVWSTFLVIFSRFDGWFCVLTGIFDETHKHLGQRVTGVGGFIFRKDALSAFLSELDGIEGSDLSASKLRYFGKQDTLDVLAKIVGRNRGAGFICTVANDVFEEWRRNSPDNAAWLGKPYSACVFSLLGMVHQHLARNGQKDEVFYTIEAGADGRPEAERFLRLIDTQERVKSLYRFRGYVFLSKKGPDGPLFRGADLLVNEWQRNLRDIELEEARKKSETGWSEPIKLLFPGPESLPIYYQELSVPALHGACAEMAFHQLVEK